MGRFHLFTFIHFIFYMIIISIGFLLLPYIFSY